MDALASPRCCVREAEAKAFASDSARVMETEPEAEEHPLSLLLTSARPADDAALWSLISPCSDASDDGAGFFPGDEEEQHDADCAVEKRDAQEVDQTPPADVVNTVESGSDGQVEAEGEGQESDEEVEAVDAESFWAAVERPPPGELAWWADSDQEEEEEEEESSSLESDEAPSDAGEPEEAAAANSAAVVATPLWGRLKARSYAGATSSGVHAAVASIKQRARTISSMATASTRHLEVDDDGDFSSDDEDCNRRKSDAMGPRHRRQSLAFAARLSLAAPALDSLRNARGRFGHKLLLFRSSSSGTVTSEESFLGSPGGGGETKSAPASMRLGASYSAVGKPSSSSTSLQVPKHLHAGVSRAAGFFTAASAEAARKLKAKTTPLRGQKKPAASETEEEEPETAASTSASVDEVSS